MKSTELFWSQIASYNLNTWGGQLLLLVLGVVVTPIALAVRGRWPQVVLKLYLGAVFAWLAIAFFWLHDHTWLGRILAVLFLGVAGLFVLDVWRDRSLFRLPADRPRRILTLAILALVLAFPLLGMAQGRQSPYLASPIMPCPVSAYALALLAAAAPRIDRIVCVPLLVWAAFAVPKMFGMYGAREDTVLVVAGLYLGIVLITHRTARVGSGGPDRRPRVRRMG